MNKRIVLIGYSGHSYGCVEVAIKQGFSIVGYVDFPLFVDFPNNVDFPKNRTGN